MYIFIHVYMYSDFTCFGQSQFSCLLACEEGEYHIVWTDIGIKLLSAVGVSLLSKTHSLFM